MTGSDSLPQCYSQFVDILKEELVPALGCTEPIAIAFVAATARQVLGALPQAMEVRASGNIIKNVKGVTVPTTKDLKGIPAAALTGAVGGDPALGLEVLSAVQPQHILLVRDLLAQGVCRQCLLDTPAKLHIILTAQAGQDNVLVELVHQHTNIVRIEKNGQTLLSQPFDPNVAEGALTPRDGLNIDSILDFAQNVPIHLVEEVITRQIDCNCAISQAGLQQPYGARVGASLLQGRGDCVITRAKAAAAAGSDARMSGCELPVVTNSGSGNQGMTVSLPVIEYAGHMGAPRQQLIRALLISNLVAIYQKSRIGRLSAFCGAVSAAAGAGAGIAWLRGMSRDQICDTVVSTLANTGGMVCDGAKPSCAAKIASAVDSAIMACDMAAQGHRFHSGEGLVKDDFGRTVDAITKMAREGMVETDSHILRIMLED